MKPDEPHTGSKELMGTMGPAPGLEIEWIERARRGETEAFRALVERHRDRAYALALRIVRVPADAEEVAQDAFVRVWRALPRFRGDAAFTTWLHRIVVRLAFDRAARLAARRTREARRIGREAMEPSGHRSADTGEAGEKLERLMTRLTEAQRAVVTLYYFYDRSVEDAARVLGMPENTVKTHLSRARSALRAAWQESERG
ncbi:MAG TPA: RNA polymerase sigma factor [Candidatus Eisenbacteria bacterium]|nr:RNA polymerase sigma factor [Candidatus Eisenbacteria bacterium]